MTTSTTELIDYWKIALTPASPYWEPPQESPHATIPRQECVARAAAAIREAMAVVSAAHGELTALEWLLALHTCAGHTIILGLKHDEWRHGTTPVPIVAEERAPKKKPARG